MDKKELVELTEIYSADLARWPQEKVKPALALIERDAEARAVFDAALALDAELRLYDAPARDLSALEERICAAVRAEERDAIMPPPAARMLRFGGVAAQAFGLVLALFLGFVTGAPPSVDGAASEGLSAEMLYAPDQLVAAEDEAIITMIGEI